MPKPIMPIRSGVDAHQPRGVAVLADRADRLADHRVLHQRRTSAPETPAPRPATTSRLAATENSPIRTGSLMVAEASVVGGPQQQRDVLQDQQYAEEHDQRGVFEARERDGFARTSGSISSFWMISAEQTHRHGRDRHAEQRTDVPQREQPERQ